MGTLFDLDDGPTEEPTLKQTGKLEAAERERKALLAALDGAEALRKHESCRWWLDRRDNTARELLAGADPKPGDTYNQSAPDGWEL